MTTIITISLILFIIYFIFKRMFKLIVIAVLSFLAYLGYLKYFTKSENSLTSLKSNSSSFDTSKTKRFYITSLAFLLLIFFNSSLSFPNLIKLFDCSLRKSVTSAKRIPIAMLPSLFKM